MLRHCSWYGVDLVVAVVFAVGVLVLVVQHVLFVVVVSDVGHGVVCVWVLCVILL